MTHTSNRKARILVATDVATDAALVRKLLSDDFDHIVCSTDPDRSVDDFDAARPEVLILAFNDLEKAERYYLGLYRGRASVHGEAHRTIILCNKDDLQRVFEMCRREYFDDYVLFWPLTYDAPRLRMSVHLMIRQLHRENTGEPSASQFAALARHVRSLQAPLEEGIARVGNEVGAAVRLLAGAETDIDGVIGRWPKRSDAGGTAAAGAADPEWAHSYGNGAGEDGLRPALQSAIGAFSKVDQGLKTLQKTIAPHRESLRELGEMADRVRWRILVADDDPFQHERVRAALGKEQFSIVSVHGGAEALASMPKHRPDLVLMDIGMPDIDGVEVARRLKANAAFAATPILMFTGRSDKSVVVASRNAGAVGFVVKPFEDQMLRSKVTKLLEGSRRASESAVAGGASRAA